MILSLHTGLFLSCVFSDLVKSLIGVEEKLKSSRFAGVINYKDDMAAINEMNAKITHVMEFYSVSTS
jgi:hypothetical protein